jgi:hypothetical protein
MARKCIDGEAAGFFGNRTRNPDFHGLAPLFEAAQMCCATVPNLLLRKIF